MFHETLYLLKVSLFLAISLMSLSVKAQRERASIETHLEHLERLAAEAETQWFHDFLNWYSPCLKDIHCVQWHIANGANVNMTMGYPPANLTGYPLIEYYGAIPIRAPGMTPLILAASHEGNTAVVQLLIHYGADVNAQNSFGWSALHAAANTNHRSPDVAQVLINAGADSNLYTTPDLLTPLLVTRRAGIAQVLLSANADIDALDSSGQSSLHNAAMDHNLSLTQVLIHHGADVDVISDGKTPLDIALITSSRSSEERVLAVVLALLEAGAEPPPVNGLLFRQLRGLLGRRGQ